LRGLTPRAEREKSQKVSDSHRNDVSPLTQGLRYSAACDGNKFPSADALFTLCNSNVQFIIYYNGNSL